MCELVKTVGGDDVHDGISGLNEVAAFCLTGITNSLLMFLWKNEAGTDSESLLVKLTLIVLRRRICQEVVNYIHGGEFIPLNKGIDDVWPIIIRNTFTNLTAVIDKQKIENLIIKY